MKMILISLAPLLFAAPAASAPPASVSELFVITFSPGPGWIAGRPMAEQQLREHGSYHAQLVREGRSVAAGGYVGWDGGMAIVRATNLEEAQKLLAADPAIQNQVFKAEIRMWRPRFVTDAPIVQGLP